MMRSLVVTATVVLALWLAPSVALAAGGESTTTGAFSLVGALAEARVGHTATALPDGRVLVVGGGPESGGFILFAIAELWDPATSSFAPAGRLTRGRSGHSATALPDGRVLVVGGLGTGGTTASAEVWDPATESFAPTGALAEDRGWHTATLLPDGRVLVVGGAYLDLEPFALGSHTSAEVWEPVSGTFTPAGSLAGARYGHTALPLPDGRVLIVGGDAAGADPPPAMAEIWEPATVGFSPAAALPTERQSYDAVLVDDGRVLLVGGFRVAGDDLEPVAQAQLWDPASGAVEPAGSLAAGRWGHTTTRLPDGRVLVTGGQDWDHMLASAEVWSPASLRFEPAGAFVPARHSHTATMLPDGRVLIVGGWDPDGLGRGLAIAEVWAPGNS